MSSKKGSKEESSSSNGPIAWSFDLNISKSNVDPPLGFVKSTSLSTDKADTEVSKTDEAKLLALKKKRAMDMGTAPGKQLFMTMFMLWMAGGGVHIFSIMIVGMSVMNPIKAITSVQSHFQPLEADGIDLMTPKAAFIGLNLVGLGIALYKCFMMGLLPLSSTDWVRLVEVPSSTEVAGGGVSFA